MLTDLRRRRPSTTWPSQSARSTPETDAELRHRLGIAPLATPAIAPVVAVPATSNDLQAVIGVPVTVPRIESESFCKTAILFFLFDRLWNKVLGDVGILAWLSLWTLAGCAARAEPVRKALLEVLVYAFGTYLFEPGCFEAWFLHCLAGHAAIYIESKFPRRAAIEVVPASAVAVAM